jgi:hypothetical protein
MGHSSSNIYEKYYQDLHVRCDVQNTFIGIPSEDRLLKSANAMSRKIDPRLPKNLDRQERRHVRDSIPEMKELQRQIDQARADCISQYGRIKDAVGSESHNSMTHLRRSRNALQMKGERRALKEKRDEHLKSAPKDDVQRQLTGQESTVPVPDSKEVVFAHVERSRLAEALFSSHTPVPDSEEDVQRRIATLKDLIALCSLREPRTRSRSLSPIRVMDCADATVTEPDASPSERDVSFSKLLESNAMFLDMIYDDVYTGPLELNCTTCLHCLFDLSLGGLREQESRYSRKDALQLHAQRKHFKGCTEETLMNCPHDWCKDQIFTGLSHFKNHAAMVTRHQLLIVDKSVLPRL